jgi:adenylate cyclase
MAVPLLSKGQLQGVLYLDTRERAGAFTEKDLRILTGVAAQTAVAIENAELARRIEQEAETRAHLSRFLSPALVEQAQGQLAQKGGELCEVTVLGTSAASPV